MKDISGASSDWDSGHIARTDARHDFRLAHQARRWKRTGTKHLFCDTFGKAWELHKKLLVNELASSPIEFVSLDRRTATGNRSPQPAGASL